MERVNSIKVRIDKFAGRFFLLFFFFYILWLHNVVWHSSVQFANEKQILRREPFFDVAHIFSSTARYGIEGKPPFDDLT